MCHKHQPELRDRIQLPSGFNLLPLVFGHLCMAMSWCTLPHSHISKFVYKILGFASSTCLYRTQLPYYTGKCSCSYIYFSTSKLLYCLCWNKYPIHCISQQSLSLTNCAFIYVNNQCRGECVDSLRRIQRWNKFSSTSRHPLFICVKKKHACQNGLDFLTSFYHGLTEKHTYTG